MPLAPEKMGQVEATALLNAALLAAGRPVADQELCTLLGVGPEGLKGLVDDLARLLRDERLGLAVEQVAGGYRLVVDPHLVPMLADLFAPPPLPQLSNAALETLALVAYRQPITRGELEAARGASCASTLDTLQERELVKVIGRKDVVGRPMLYATTERFLMEFGLRSLNDLPDVDDAPERFLRG